MSTVKVVWEKREKHFLTKKGFSHKNPKTQNPKKKEGIKNEKGIY
jgi:hypothetical protein